MAKRRGEPRQRDSFRARFSWSVESAHGKLVRFYFILSLLTEAAIVTSEDAKPKVRGVTISNPVVRPFAEPVRVLEWKGSRGETHLKVVPARITAAAVEQVVRQHVCGTQYIFVNAHAAA
jgi:hypothetical protein